MTSQPPRSDPVETRGPEIPESVYMAAREALDDPDVTINRLGRTVYLDKAARAAVDAAVAELGLRVETTYDSISYATNRKINERRRYISPWLPRKEANDG